MKRIETWLRSIWSRPQWIVFCAGAIIALVVDFGRGGNGVLGLVGALLLAVMTAYVPAPRPEVRVRREDNQNRSQSLSVHALATALDEPIYIIDTKTGTIEYANATAREAFGPVDRDTSFDLKFRAPEMRILVEKALHNGATPATIDLVERVPVERMFRVVAARIGPKSRFVVLHFKDQSEARRIDRMRADFIANASHELRTPLASVSGFIETLRGPAKNDEKAREQFLQIMQKQAARMARLIDDLLSLSRIEIKPFAHPRERIDLKQLVQGVGDTLRQFAEQQGVTIALEFPDGPFEVRGFPDELVQVFENLMVNACKYGAEGHKVEVSAALGDGGERVITIRDYGPGIPEEHLPRLTERFYRADIQTSRMQEGTGLGLAIVKHLLTRHGARLTIRSKLGEGAAFSVHFPSPDDIGQEVSAIAMEHRA